MMVALRMAWRDWRARPTRFLLYMAAIAVGVGALTAVESFRLQVQSAIDGQGRELLGADLLLRSRSPFSEAQEAWLRGWKGGLARAVTYRTLLLPAAEVGSGARLVEVEAVESGYPFYGGLGTEPGEAAVRMQAQGHILVDRTLMLQLGLDAGAAVQVGGQSFVIGGALLRSPGEVPARSLLAPKVILPYRLLDAARLNRPGTMARYSAYLAMAEAGADEEAGVRREAAAARRLGWDVETVAGRREQLMGSTDRISRYLGLIGFSALLIGCLGVAGAIHFFIDSNQRMVAQLRCMGATWRQAAGMFLIQLVWLALLGTTLGVVAGLEIGRRLPLLLTAFLPVELATELRGSGVVYPWLLGLAFTILAGLPALTRLRRLRPLLALRPEVAGPGGRRRFDGLGLGALVLLLAALFLFAVRQLGGWWPAALYLGGVGAMLLLLVLTGWLLRRVCRAIIRPGWPYALRLAVSGLYRPHNQTLLLVAGLGLGVALMNMVVIVEAHLLRDIEVTGSHRPNLAMIDIQPDQQAGLAALVAEFPVKSLRMEPMVTMRLVALNGTPVAALEAEVGSGRPNWALKREYRTTYRSEVKADIERVIAGRWFGGSVAAGAVVPVSLERSIAEALQVWVGDRLTFDLHGERLETEVANVREVDWKSMQPNFFIIFPPGPLDEAPRTTLLFCEIEEAEQRALLQRRIAERFANVTVLDIAAMLETVEGMLRQVAVAVRGLAWSALLAGFLVLLAVLRVGQRARLREGVLLRMIGASRGVVAWARILEVVILTLVAMAGGLVLSWIGGGLVVHYALKLPYRPGASLPLGAMSLLLVVTTLVGWANGWGLARQRPADAWRALERGGGC